MSLRIRPPSEVATTERRWLLFLSLQKSDGWTDGMSPPLRSQLSLSLSVRAKEVLRSGRIFGTESAEGRDGKHF